MLPCSSRLAERDASLSSPATPGPPSFNAWLRSSVHCKPPRGVSSRAKPRSGAVEGSAVFLLHLKCACRPLNKYEGPEGPSYDRVERTKQHVQTPPAGRETSVASVASYGLSQKMPVDPEVVVCGDFNATLDKPSAALMASRFQPTQTMPTAFTPLAGLDGATSHPYWPRMDRCIDYIWTAGAIKAIASGVWRAVARS